MKLRNVAALLGLTVVPLLCYRTLSAAQPYFSNYVPTADSLPTSFSAASLSHLYGSAGSPADGWHPESDVSSSPPPPPANEAIRATSAPDSVVQATASVAVAEVAWMRRSNFVFSPIAHKTLAHVAPRGTTLHFTFGTSVMMDFVKNWVHFVKRAGLSPILIGAADLTLLRACEELQVPAAGIVPELDVWTYKRKPKRTEVYEMKSDWGYIRHHKSDFLEMGLVKVCPHAMLT